MTRANRIADDQYVDYGSRRLHPPNLSDCFRAINSMKRVSALGRFETATQRSSGHSDRQMAGASDERPVPRVKRPGLPAVLNGWSWQERSRSSCSANDSTQPVTAFHQVAGRSAASPVLQSPRKNTRFQLHSGH